MSTTNHRESLPGPSERMSTKFKDGSNKKLRKNKWQQRRAHSTKVHVKLPSIESYQKELEFNADAPGRVIVRLERLMGSDKIRITDAKYMSTLLERLEQEENEAWLKRTRERKQAERNRFRQLAVEGLMEPTTDMEDLYNHPVFRVNRILNRLAKLDTDITLTPMRKLPPITPVEPFAGVFDGKLNYSYTPNDGNEVDETEEESLAWSPLETNVYEETETEDELEGNVEVRIPETNNERKSSEWGGEDYQNSMLGDDTLPSIQERYGIPANEKIEQKWKPFRSKLVEFVFDAETGGASTMYDVARDVLGAYQRETMTADDFVVKLGRLL